MVHTDVPNDSKSDDKDVKPRPSIKEIKRKKSRIKWFSVALIVLVCDQLSKWYVTESFLRPKLQGDPGLNLIDWYLNTPSILPYVSIKISSFFNIVMAWNTGVSFSLFSGMGGYVPLILIIVALGITVLFSVWLWKADYNWQRLCYALVIGGALGNVIDRARFGAVIDFLDFHFLGYHWPAFNVADMAVVTGIFLLIILSLYFDLKMKQRYRKRRNNQKPF